jgi:hypothetical protein
MSTLLTALAGIPTKWSRTIEQPHLLHHLSIGDVCGWEVTEGSYFLDLLRSTEGSNF